MHLSRDREARRRNSSQAISPKRQKFIPQILNATKGRWKQAPKREKHVGKGTTLRMINSYQRSLGQTGQPAGNRREPARKWKCKPLFEWYNSVVHHKNSNISTLNVKQICSIGKLAVNSFFRPVLDSFFTQHIKYTFYSKSQFNSFSKMLFCCVLAKKLHEVLQLCFENYFMAMD